MVLPVWLPRGQRTLSALPTLAVLLFSTRGAMIGGSSGAVGVSTPEPRHGTPPSTAATSFRPQPRPQAGSQLHSVFWDLAGANLTLQGGALDDFEAQALAYSLQGLANREGPALLYDTGRWDVDYPDSDRQWASYLRSVRGVELSMAVPPSLCSLVEWFAGTRGGENSSESRGGSSGGEPATPLGAVVYPSDGFSIYIALTIAGQDSLLPM